MTSGGLCHRCEYRARFLEDGLGPRYECQQAGRSICGCYMYRPVRPVVLKPRAGDKRPAGGPWAIAARCDYAGIWPELELRGAWIAGELHLFWDCPAWHNAPAKPKAKRRAKK